MYNKIKSQVITLLLASTYILTVLGCSGARHHMDAALTPQPIEKEKSHQVNHLANQQPTLISKGGHQIEFLDNQLDRVLVKENLPYPFSRDLILPVYKEDSNLGVKDILMHGVEWHKNNLHIQFPTSQHKGHLYIGSVGLRGGGNSPSRPTHAPCDKCGNLARIASETFETERRWYTAWFKKHKYSVKYRLECVHCLALEAEQQRVAETRRREEERKKEELKRKHTAEAHQREEERLKMEQNHELAYQQLQQASEALTRNLLDQKKQEEDRLAKLEIERQIVEQQLIKEQIEEEEMLRKKVEQERLRSKEEEALRDKELKQKQAEAERLALEKEEQRLREVQLVRERQQVDQQLERQLKEEQWKKKKEARKAENERVMQEFEHTIANDQVEEEKEAEQLQDTDTTDDQLADRQKEIHALILLEEDSEDEMDTFITACLQEGEKQVNNLQITHR